MAPGTAASLADTSRRSRALWLSNLPLRLPWLRWAAFALCLAFGAGSTYFFYRAVQEDSRSKFRSTALGMTHQLDSRIRAYGDVLYALRGLFDAADRVTRTDFREFAQALSLGERYPGVTNISYSFRVMQERKARFERAVRADIGVRAQGIPEFSIRPPGERPEYLVLTYIEPMGKNVAAWGLDTNADPLRRSAVERTRDTGQIASSSGVTLVRDSNSGVTSTLLRLAVYRGGGVPPTLAERRRLYSGMVGSTVRLEEMIAASIPKATLAGVRLRVFDGGELAGASPSRLLFDNLAGVAPSAGFSSYAVVQHLAVGDREWQVEIVPLLNPTETLSGLAVAAMLAASLAISVLLFWLVSTVATSESRGRELAKRNREAALLKALGEDLHSSLGSEQAFAAVGKHMPRLIPDTAGSVHIYTGMLSRDSLVAGWGAATGAAASVGPNERIPLSAHGEVIGFMHVRHAGASSAPCTEKEMELLGAASQHIGLALANLALREKLREEATHDTLTGLYNRKYMREWLAQELYRSERHGRSISVIMVDIDHFKRVNDSFGHAAGDMVLRELARVMRRIARKSDVVCRQGGEEFLILMPEAPLHAAARKAEELRKAVSLMKLEYEGKPLGPLTLSLGVAGYPEHAKDLDELLRRADVALYAAKGAGRNRAEVAGVMAAAELETR